MLSCWIYYRNYEYCSTWQINKSNRCIKRIRNFNLGVGIWIRGDCNLINKYVTGSNNDRSYKERFKCVEKFLKREVQLELQENNTKAIPTHFFTIIKVELCKPYCQYQQTLIFYMEFAGKKDAPTHNLYVNMYICIHIIHKR